MTSFDPNYACYIGPEAYLQVHDISAGSRPRIEPPYHPRMPIFNEALYGGRKITPKLYVENFEKKEYSPRKIKKNLYTQEWYLEERDNGRTIDIGKFILKNPFIINPTSLQNFDACKFCVRYDEQEYDVVLTEKEYKSRKILQHFSFLKRNPDCPDKYLIDAIYLAFQELECWKFLFTPKNSGWQELPKGKPFFASNLSVYPNLDVYYPNDVRERQLLNTSRTLIDIAKDYAEKLPKIWQYKLLVAIRLVCLMLYFAANNGINPDQLFVVETGSESATKVAISLLKTQNYTSLSSLSLLATKTQLKEYLNKVNDGIAIFTDNSYVEDGNKRSINIDMLIDDLYNRNGIEHPQRHCIAIVSDNPGNLHSEIPAMYIDISSIVPDCDAESLQKISGEFDTAFINAFEKDPENMCAMLNEYFKASEISSKTILNSEKYNSEKLVRAGVCILNNFGLITKKESRNIFYWLEHLSASSRDSATVIVNDFRKVINSILFSEVKVYTQFGNPYYFRGQDNTCFVDDNHLNFELQVWERFLFKMETTKKRQKVLHALQSCNMIYSNNGFKRILEVEVAPGILRKVSVYSISKKILYPENFEKTHEIFFSNYYFTKDEASINNLRPMISNKSKTMLCGQSPNEDLNYHQLISGDPRSGKTTYESEQAVAAAINDEAVLVIDNDGSWSEDILKNHLSDEVVEKYFSFWSIPNQGLPINIADLSNCNSLPEKKNLLFSILSSATRSLGELQAKVLKKQIGAMLKEKNNFNINDILTYLDEKDDVQKTIYNKISDILQDFEGLPTTSATWKDFIYSQKKIIVISTGKDAVAKDSNVTDMLLSSFYAYKQHYPKMRTTIILDEVQDLDISIGSAIDIILRKGAKRGIRMLLATHEFSAVRDKLGKIFGNCRTLVFFKPKHDDLKDIARITGVDVSMLAKLEQGQCVVYGLLFNREEKKNKQTTIIGWTYNHKFAKSDKTPYFKPHEKKVIKNRSDNSLQNEVESYYNEQNPYKKRFDWGLD